MPGWSGGRGPLRFDDICRLRHEIAARLRQHSRDSRVPTVSPVVAGGFHHGSRPDPFVPPR